MLPDDLGYSHSSLAHAGLIAVRKTLDLIMDRGSLACCENLFVGRREARIADIVDDGIVKEDWSLRDDTDRLPETGFAKAPGQLKPAHPFNGASMTYLDKVTSRISCPSIVIEPALTS